MSGDYDSPILARLFEEARNAPVMDFAGMALYPRVQKTVLTEHGVFEVTVQLISPTPNNGQRDEHDPP